MQNDFFSLRQKVVQFVNYCTTLKKPLKQTVIFAITLTDTYLELWQINAVDNLKLLTEKKGFA